MADNKTYVRGDSKSIYEGMTKEEILAAIAQAVQSGTISDLDTGFITRLKEINHGNALQFWVGTSAEYNALEALGEIQNNVLYIKTDDTSAADISESLALHEQQIYRNIATLAGHNVRITALEEKTYIPVGGIMLTNTDISTAEAAAAAAGFGTWSSYGTLTASANTINCWLRTA